MCTADYEQSIRRQRVLQVADGQTESGFNGTAAIAMQLANQLM